MNTKKIGLFIAEKRKALNLTQKQLAEKLGMSDKSVSKWERGVCLPDVSIYTPLCEILGISLNEFFAGEEIKSENIETVSEENLIQVSKNSKKKQKFLKGIIAIVTAVLLVVALLLASFVWGPFIPQSYMKAIDRESEEVRAMNYIALPDQVYPFNFVKTDKYKEIQLNLSTYKKGKKIDSTMIISVNVEDLGPSKKGKIIVVPNFEDKNLKVVVICKNGTYSSQVKLLHEVQNGKDYSRAVDFAEEKQKIKDGKENGLVAIYYGKNEIRSGSVQGLGGKTEPYKNDYTYFVSYKFVE